MDSTNTTQPPLLAGQRMLAVTEEEMQRIILDVHDGPVQKLFAACSQVELMQSRLGQLPDHIRGLFEADLERVDSLLQVALAEIRNALGTLRPPEFRRRPLVSVLQGLILQHESLTGVHVSLTVTGEVPTVSLPMKIALYRIVQEALANAHRHAQVDHLDVRLVAVEGWIILDVIDQGRGFDPPPLDGPQGTERQEHIGLRGMRERAALVGGHITLTSHRGRGTHIKVQVPYDA